MVSDSGHLYWTFSDCHVHVGPLVPALASAPSLFPCRSAGATGGVKVGYELSPMHAINLHPQTDSFLFPLLCVCVDSCAKLVHRGTIVSWSNYQLVSNRLNFGRTVNIYVFGCNSASPQS